MLIFHMSRFDVNFPSNYFHKINKALYYDYIPNGKNTKESSYGIEHTRNINFGDNKVFGIHKRYKSQVNST